MARKPLPPRVIRDPLQRRFAEEVEGAWARSPLGQWMAAHRAELEALLQQHPADWQLVAQHCADAGLLDVRGRRPTAETAEQTWRRVTAGKR